ncbi:acetyl-CoA synthetase-like protein [Ascoidea rubescens DSM 1968]|uniref:Acetyl-CoA synthetase-like protein n=1 Tax=Ascoidea rubescens DSM 1968 TaxID=1344418 RepID=A0A1D2V9H0_9ASCO|nr:acetyl-CoA synthetase-like protein [Ascoidea rubescens DSM 1968]ODV58219.1 acetyl-CoA synthetase-like protein [Ascoidea rubescens DSM 1968]
MVQTKEDFKFDESLGYVLTDKEISSFRDFYSNLPLPSNQVDVGAAVANSGAEGYSSIYRPVKLVNLGELSRYLTPFLDTYFKFFEVATNLHPDANCLGERLVNRETNKLNNYFSFQTFKEVCERRNKLGSGILNVVRNNINYRKFTSENARVYSSDDENYNYEFILTLYSSNRIEWVLTDLACQAFGLPNTALYDTLGSETSGYILNLTRSPIIFCSKGNISKILRLKQQDYKDELKYLLIIVSMDKLDIEEDYYLIKFAESINLQVYDLSSLEKIGEKFPINLRPARKDELYTISFTSGTTGLPKGVEVSQLNLACGINLAYSQLGKPLRPKIDYLSEEQKLAYRNKQARVLVFLPLAHIYERQIAAFEMICGCALGFPSSRNPVVTLIEDLKSLRPYSLTAVPRIFTKIESAIKLIIKNSSHKIIEKKILEIEARDSKDGDKDRNEDDEEWLFDETFIKRLHGEFGFENVQYCLTASAPIAVETVKFLKAALKVGFRQGYGLTESMAAITISKAYEREPGSCGVGGITIDYRLRDVPEMNYQNKNKEGKPKGELMLRGPQIFSRYFKNEKATKESFDKDGFFHTGDICMIEPMNDNRLFIIDRIKNFFKLSQGEYISPEKIETIYLSACPMVQQAFIYGNSLKNYLVGIIGIDFENFQKNVLNGTISEFEKIRGGSGNSNYGNNNERQLNKLIKLVEENGKEEKILELVNESYFIKRSLVVFLNSQVEELSRQMNKKLLQSFEKVHNMKIAVNPLTLEDGLVTPTLKIRRNNCGVFFKPELDELYREGSLIKNDKL